MLFNDYENRVKDELDRQAEPFGADLDTSGMFVQPFPQRKYDIAEEVRLKPWPTEIAQRLDSSDLALLIINRDFASFDPREHAHAVIVLDDYLTDVDSIKSLLNQIFGVGIDLKAILRDIADRLSSRSHSGAPAAP